MWSDNHTLISLYTLVSLWEIGR